MSNLLVAAYDSFDNFDSKQVDNLSSKSMILSPNKLFKTGDI